VTRLLLVEDVVEERRLARLHLGDLADDVIEAASLRGAVAALAGGDCDVILLDLGLPDVDDLLDGLHVLSELAPDSVVLVLTGHDRPGLREECVRLGAGGYLDKPASRDHLRASVLSALRQRRIGQLWGAIARGVLRASEEARCALGA